MAGELVKIMKLLDKDVITDEQNKYVKLLCFETSLVVVVATDGYFALALFPLLLMSIYNMHKKKLFTDENGNNVTANVMSFVLMSYIIIGSIAVCTLMRLLSV